MTSDNARPLPADKPLVLGGREFRSRLFVGTGKYASFELMVEALEASGCEVVTVALRRVDLDAHKRGQKNLLDYLDRQKYTILPNTAGCFAKEDAIKVCLLARELGLGDMVKLEVLSEQKTLLPDPLETLEATKLLVKEGFKVLAYTNDDPVIAKKLEEAGATAVMPLGSPIGSGLGILNPTNISIILENAKVPIIVDAGVGTASDVAIAMELGVDGVLLNTGIACAQDPVKMARAMKLACEAGRLAYLAGRIPKKRYASASSPMKDF
ncbi:MAG: thiazole synthase [Candidatus Sumerlaeaceae bacterium]|jgi:thiazole synthase